MRIEEERERRSERQRRVIAVGAGGVGAGRGQQQFRRRHRGKDLAETAHLDGNDNDGGERGDVDQNVLDDGDRGGRAQAAGIGEGRQNNEGDDQRQIAHIAGAGNAHAGDDHLQADQLQRDVGHGRNEAGDRHRQRQPAIAEAAAHEIRRRDVVVLAADVPEPRKHQEQDRIDHDGVGHGEEGDGAGAERQRRHGDEGIGRVEVAADQEPGDDGAETPAAEPPFMQQIEVALAPARGGKTEPGDEGEQQDENDQRSPVHVRHGVSPDLFVLVARPSGEATTVELSVEHDLVGKPASTPDQVRAGFSGHARSLVAKYTIAVSAAPMITQSS